MSGAEYDVAIVGARVAGAITAALLGDAGHRVLLVDAATFPSDTISTHFFRGAGLVTVLRRLEVLEQVLALGAPPLTRQYSFSGGSDQPEIGPPQDPGDVGYSLSARRLPLDRILLDRARRSPGVDIREATAARRVLRDDHDRVVGLEVETDGRRDAVGARLVVGADGRGSSIARQVGAPETRREPATRAMYFQYLRDYPPPGARRDGPEFSLVGDELVYAFPSDDDVTCLAVSVSLDRFAAFRSSPQAVFVARMDAHPGIRDRFRSATPASRLLGSGPKDAVIRQASGPGWALVGDAGMHQDPWTGLGMDNASGQAVILAECLDSWLRGATPEREALDDYAQRRLGLSLAGFEFTASAGRDLSTLVD